MSQGHFISLEGGEGSGKSTQMEKLAQALKKTGREILSTREPGGTQIGQGIRKILLDGRRQDFSPITELLLYAADRSQHVAQVIQPSLQKGLTVLCDRFQDSTTVYQGVARGLPMDLIRGLESIATLGVKPQWTLLLDIDPELGLKRSHARLQDEGSAENRFEQEELAFHRKVREGFLNLAKEEPKRFKVFNADQDMEKLHQEIFTWVEEKLKHP